MNAVLDTNIVLYLLSGRLADPPRGADYCISVITEIEVLGYRFDLEEDRIAAQTLVAGIQSIPITKEVKVRSIDLRRSGRIKLPDAIIAATALALDLEILSNDADMARIPGLRSRRLPMRIR